LCPEKGGKLMAPMVKKILYATDLSKNSAFAFRYAMDFAEKNDAELIILHVLEEIPPNTRAMLSLYLAERKIKDVLFDEKSDLKKQITDRLGAFCDLERKNDASCTARVGLIEVCEGYPAEEILKKADELECDAIIMGTHGKGTISHTFLGSVAQKVLRRVRKPVYIIPLPKDETLIDVPDI